MIGASLRALKHREAVMLRIRSEKADSRLTVLQYVIRDHEPQIVLVEAQHCGQFLRCNHHMLQSPGQVCGAEVARWRSAAQMGLRTSKQGEAAIGITHCKCSLPEDRTRIGKRLQT